ncbi:hypothetical protein HBI56_124270 [Parastagonospora nodorum]|uniref:N-acetyltransferase domain-containing protein n=1 Tax=Phaeosphaeria nodorum (strain SN15 / ATCC MYA-4574 / FGSC 10173) TaxID=321614 RepID=A0A7U2F4E5_PHANO|nr:hypothetical protein HBH56_165600 [Parastagonospora nodorum]QRC98501.1 hypothetical protein JI435_045530 [Parastagonospora nodorum SN15]KAH3936555.1 hypothetical protein HBH54_028690 [Parastagonospora nodorum]KAH3948260.1 hypothetical protein HBH53_103460 [Parastagonospora nodorum]KAH3968736.1 hypothetical protein HBH51_127360 [Parastagonospora nodorum]
MSGLLVQPVLHEDALKCAQLRTASLGSLVIGRPPPYPGYLEDQVETIQNDLVKKPHVHHLKVVDADEIIAYAKWEIYPNGRPDLGKLKQPMDEESKTVDQYGRLREAAHEYFCRRNGGPMGSRPHILLALLVTSEEHRRRGAGSLLLQWGIERSEQSKIPCYLQASAQGRRLYGKYGFQAIETVEFDLFEYGLEGTEEMTEMIRQPSDI